MSQRRFLIRFENGDEQPVVADQVIKDEDCLIFFNPDGELAAFFDLRVVDEWHEVDVGE